MKKCNNVKEPLTRRKCIWNAAAAVLQTFNNWAKKSSE
jgi:hypothetical protein